MIINKDLETHFWIGHSSDESFEDTYKWTNATFLDYIVYVTTCEIYEGIWYLGFHLAEFPW